MKSKGARKCIVWRRPETNFLDMSCFNSAAFLQSAGGRKHNGHWLPALFSHGRNEALHELCVRGSSRRKDYLMPCK